MYSFYPIFLKTFSLAMLAQLGLHFIPQLEMQVYNVTLPIPVTFLVSCILVLLYLTVKLPLP